MIKEGILSEITILICDPPSDGKFLYCPKLTGSPFLNFFKDGKPEVIYEAYKFTIQESSKLLNEPERATPDGLAMSGQQRSSTILVNRSGKRTVELKRTKIGDKKSKSKERNTLMQNMICEVFEKMNEFAQKRDVSITINFCVRQVSF